MVTERGAVLERFPAKVLPSALATIHGTVRVDVRVTAGRDGRVVDAAFAEHGPSRYFADAAMKAAQQWRFEPAKVDGHTVESVWLLKFGFRRGGGEMTATEEKP
jgi:TonB family protein